MVSPWYWYECIVIIWTIEDINSSGKKPISEPVTWLTLLQEMVAKLHVLSLFFKNNKKVCDSERVILMHSEMFSVIPN